MEAKEGKSRCTKELEELFSLKQSVIYEGDPYYYYRQDKLVGYIMDNGNNEALYKLALWSNNNNHGYNKDAMAHRLSEDDPKYYLYFTSFPFIDTSYLVDKFVEACEKNKGFAENPQKNKNKSSDLYKIANLYLHFLPKKDANKIINSVAKYCDIKDVNSFVNNNREFINENRLDLTNVSKRFKNEKSEELELRVKVF